MLYFISMETFGVETLSMFFRKTVFFPIFLYAGRFHARAGLNFQVGVDHATIKKEAFVSKAKSSTLARNAKRERNEIEAHFFKGIPRD